MLAEFNARDQFLLQLEHRVKPAGDIRLVVNGVNDDGNGLAAAGLEVLAQRPPRAVVYNAGLPRDLNDDVLRGHVKTAKRLAPKAKAFHMRVYKAYKLLRQSGLFVLCEYNSLGKYRHNGFLSGGYGMTFILLDNDRLKICLTKKEIHQRGLDENRLKDSDPAKIRGTLVSLLQKAREECGFCPQGAKIIVEILPDENDGCILSFTAVHGLRTTPDGCEIEPVIYGFDSAYDMVRGVTELYNRYGHRIYKSSLYIGANGFLLTIRALDYSNRQSGRFLEEYAQITGKGEVYAAYIEEHSELLIEDNAVDVLGAGIGALT
jgi:negative regulator of genetic competence, sporulation and motility